MALHPIHGRPLPENPQLVVNDHVRIGFDRVTGQLTLNIVTPVMVPGRGMTQKVIAARHCHEDVLATLGALLLDQFTPPRLRGDIEFSHEGVTYTLTMTRTAPEAVLVPKEGP